VLNDPLLQTGFATAPRDEFGSVGQAAVELTELLATHHVRANSIFGSAIDFGHFVVLFALLCIAMAVKSRRRPVAALGHLILAGVFIAAVLSTSTRNILVYFVCCATGCVFILAGFGVRALVALSLALVAIFYGTIYGVIELAPRFFLGFFDVASLFQRAQGVYGTVDRYIVNADSLTHVLFGFGYMQSLDFRFLPTTVFDNTELDIYLYAGICGVVLYVVLLLMMFGSAVKQWRETGSVAWLAVASLFVGTPLFSTLNIDLDQPYLLFVFALVVGGWAAPAARAGSSDNVLANARQVGLGVA
jgi:O-antigen ligase